MSSDQAHDAMHSARLTSSFNVKIRIETGVAWRAQSVFMIFRETGIARMVGVDRSRYQAGMTD
jgi:hypothetical protein